jgi:hypothetical protein
VATGHARRRQRDGGADEWDHNDGRGRRVGRAAPVTVGCRGSAALGPTQKNSANFYLNQNFQTTLNLN